MTRRIPAGAILGIAVVACGDSGGPSGPLFLAEVMGDSRTIATLATSVPLQVQVVDTAGQPVPR